MELTRDTALASAGTVSSCALFQHARLFGDADPWPDESGNTNSGMPRIGIFDLFCRRKEPLGLCLDKINSCTLSRVSD